MQSYWFNSTYIQIAPCNYWRLHTNQDTITHISELYQPALHVYTHQVIYSTVKKKKKPNIKIA